MILRNGCFRSFYTASFQMGPQRIRILQLKCWSSKAAESPPFWDFLTGPYQCWTFQVCESDVKWLWSGLSPQEKWFQAFWPNEMILGRVKSAQYEILRGGKRRSWTGPPKRFLNHRHRTIKNVAMIFWRAPWPQKSSRQPTTVHFSVRLVSPLLSEESWTIACLFFACFYLICVSQFFALYFSRFFEFGVVSVFVELSTALS